MATVQFEIRQIGSVGNVKCISFRSVVTLLHTHSCEYTQFSKLAEKDRHCIAAVHFSLRFSLVILATKKYSRINIKPEHEKKTHTEIGKIWFQKEFIRCKLGVSIFAR